MYSPSLNSGVFGKYLFSKEKVSAKFPDLQIPVKQLPKLKGNSLMEHVLELSALSGVDICLDNEKPGDFILLMTRLTHEFSDCKLTITNTGFVAKEVGLQIKYNCKYVLELVRLGVPFNLYKVTNVEIFYDRNDRILWESGFWKRLQQRWNEWKLNKMKKLGGSEEFPNFDNSLVALEGSIIRAYDTYYHVADYNQARYSYVVVEPFKPVFNQALSCIHRDRLRMKATSAITLIWKSLRESNFCMGNYDEQKVIACAMYYADVVSKDLTEENLCLKVKPKWFSSFRTVLKSAFTVKKKNYTRGKRVAFRGYCGEKSIYKEQCENCSLLTMDNTLCGCECSEAVQCHKMAWCLADDSMLRYPNKDVCQAVTSYCQRVGNKVPLGRQGSFDELMGFSQAVLKRILMVDSVKRPDLMSWLESIEGCKRAKYIKATEEVLMAGLVEVKHLNVKNFPKIEAQFAKVFDDFTTRDVRAISGRWEEYNVLLGPYMKLASKVLQAAWCYKDKLVEGAEVTRVDSITYASGLDKIEVGGWMDHVLEEFTAPVFYNTDYSRFDRHVSVPLLNIEHLLYSYLFENSEELLKVLRSQFETFGYISYDKDCVPLKYHVKGTRKSGDQNTSVGNSFLNVLCQLFCINKQYDIMNLLNNNLLKMIVLGDDTVIALDGLYLNLGQYERDMLSIGLEIKIAQGTKYNINFCSASFVPMIINGRDSHVLTQLFGRNVCKAYVTNVFVPKQYEQTYDLWEGWVKSTAFAYRTDYGHVPFMMKWHDDTYKCVEKAKAMELPLKECFKHLGVAVLPSENLDVYMNERYGIDVITLRSLNKDGIRKHLDVAWRLFDRDLRPDDCDMPYLPPNNFVRSDLYGKSWDYKLVSNPNYDIKIQPLVNNTMLDCEVDYEYKPIHEPLPLVAKKDLRGVLKKFVRKPKSMWNPVVVKYKPRPSNVMAMSSEELENLL